MHWKCARNDRLTAGHWPGTLGDLDRMFSARNVGAVGGGVPDTYMGAWLQLRTRGRATGTTLAGSTVQHGTRRASGGIGHWRALDAG